MKKTFRNILVLMVIMAMFVLLASPAQAYTVKQVWSRISATAGETLTTGDAVTIKDADGYAWKADADSATLRPAVGVVGKGGSAGAKIEIITSGVVSGWSSLTEGAAGYLSATAGLITQTLPTYRQQIGVAISTTDYLIAPHIAGVPVTGVAALTPGASVAVNFNNASVFTLTPAEGETITGSGGTPGATAYIVITTSGTNSYTLTFSTGFKVTGTLATGTVSAKVFVITFVYDGTNWNEVARTTAM